VVARGATCLVLSALLCGSDALAADKSGVSANTISLPKGPGSIEGLGEAFQPTLNTGTAKYRVGFAVPAGTAGHVPQLALSYEGGGGNGVLGFGWRLPTAYIQRQTDKGIPRYVDGPNSVDDDHDGMVDNADETDVFINEIKEELVPRADGFFFCENEGAFIRYRRVGDYWEGTLPDGTRMEFGRTPAARVTDVATGRVFSWLVETITETHGNTIRYSYQSFTNDSNLNQRYLAKVEYGAGAPPWANFQFITFNYEDRADWFEDCRSGFSVRTGKRLREIVVGTQGPTLPNHQQGDFNGDGTPDNLVRKYRLDYLSYAGTNTHWSYLATVTPIGADGVSVLPSSSFGYSIFNPPDSLSAAGKITGGVNEPLAVMDNPLVDLVDLNGDGLPDVLKTSAGGGAHIACLNRGETNSASSRAIVWSTPQEVASPDVMAWGVNLQSGAQPSENIAHLADMDGDGMADLVYRTPFDSVYYFKNLGSDSWDARRAMSVEDSAPPSPFGQANVKTADVDFNKHNDIIQSISTGGGADYRIWFNLGNQRYSQSVTVPQDNGFMLSDAGVEIADLNGDRVPDVCRIRPTTLQVTAGLGHGQFAALITVPIPDATLDSYQISHAKLQDITGDGLADLVIERAEPGVLWYWINLGNATFSPKKIITGLPLTPANAAIRWADLNGNGTTDYLVASADNDPKIQSVDLAILAGLDSAPNLLTRIENGIGRVTTIEYRTSSQFALEDAAAGHSWPDPMPFPVSVVSRVRTSDSLGHSYSTEFRYHDGYYDGTEKEFRGFARVEQVDVGDTNAPTLVARSYFDTGRDFEVMKGKVLRLTTETEAGAAFTDETTSWTTPPVTLYTGTNGQPVHYTHPTVSVKLIKELGQGTERRLESETDYDNFGNQTRSADYGIVENGDRSAFNDERITTTEYAINTNAWIIHEPKRSQVMDENGAVISRAEFYYDDETFSGNNLGQITLGNLTMKREWKDPANASAFIISARTKYDAYGNPIAILDPLAEAPGGAANFGKGHGREIAYDTRFHTFPVTETIHLGGGSAPLIFQASYDEGFGTVTSSTDFNANTTAYGYDTFARLTSIVRPGDSPSFPTAEYDYALAVSFQTSNLVNYVETRQLDKTNRVAGAKRDSYFISRQFVDGLGRKLLSKQEAGALTEGGPPRVSVKGAVTFNQRLKPARALNPFYSLLSGSLDDQLPYESVETPGWSGEFQLNGSLVTLNLASAHATTTEYDATLREVKTTNPDGTFRRTLYEPLLTRSFDENDTDVASPYADTPMVHQNDGLGRLIHVEELSHLNDDGTPAGTLKTWTTLYQYDLNDQLTHITDSQNNQKWMQYDGLKRKTFMNDPDRGVMSFAYDDASNLIETSDAKNQRITYTYDGANRIRSEDYHDEGQPFSANFAFNPTLPISATNRPDVAYFYDVPQAGLDVGDGSVATAANTRGKLAYVWDLSGEEHTSYDARDRVGWVVKRVRDPLHGQLVSFRTAFAYDSLDRLTGLTYPDNDAIGYRYNDRKLLQTITGGPADNILSNLVYLPSDQQAEIRYGNGVRTTYAYDSRLRLNSLVTASQASPASPLIAFGYEFDGVSNIKSITDNRPGSVVPAGDKRRNTQIFQYDDLYRLTRVQYSFTLPGAAVANNGEISYRYDRIGNMLAQNSTIDHVEKGLPVANLGEMDSGGASGRWNRAGRAASDPPGPHALTAIRHPVSGIRSYPYDPNGNMNNLDGMVATWDFKDRMVAIENADMRADYAYDSTDRRITKKVFWKKGEPLAGTNQPSALNPQPSTTTVTYVGKHFEVREHEAPTKYVFNGNTRLARVTGTLSPNTRVQRIRVSTGWNLISIAVTAPNTLQQLSLSASGGEGQGEVVSSALKWNSASGSWATFSPTETLSPGTVLWLNASTNATLRVTGVYPGPMPNLRAPPEGAFLPSVGLEAWSLPPTFNSQPTIALWSFSPERQTWQTRFPAPLTAYSDFPLTLAPGAAFFAKAPAPSDLELPDPALSLRFYHQDHLGSSSVMGDAAGALVEESANYPFGQPRCEFRPRGGREDYEFTQKERDSESGLYYFEARFLAGSVGRFSGVDVGVFAPRRSWIEEPQKFNAYSYCLNRPIMLHDPTGNDGEPVGINNCEHLLGGCNASIRAGPENQNGPYSNLIGNYLLGTGSGSQIYGPKAPYTQTMKQHPAIKSQLAGLPSILEKACATSCQPPTSEKIKNDLGALTTVGQVKDFFGTIFGFATDGLVGKDPAYGTVGSFSSGSKWQANSISCKTGKAEIDVSIENRMSAASNTRYGYSSSDQTLLPEDPLGKDYPLRTVEQMWLWQEKITFKPNPLCPD
jgi:RHS repeat-associated protein